MGNRIAKFENEDRWVVYQSVTEACYEPIFFDELSAWLYAHLASVDRYLVERNGEYSIGSDVTRFIKLSYGDTDEFAESDLYLDECADVTAGTRRGQAIVAELGDNFFTWRKNQDVAPPVRHALPQPHDHICQQCSNVCKRDCECSEPRIAYWCSARCKAAFDL